MSDSAGTRTKQKGDRPFLSLGFNFVIPAFVLTKLSGEGQLGPVNGLLAALAFPLAYGIFDFLQRRSFNAFSAIGFTGILLTGGIGLLQLDPRWIAVKEAGVPFLIGLGVIASLKTSRPFARVVLNAIIDGDKVEDALKEKENTTAFDKRVVYATYALAASFFLSAVLNYALARLIVISQPGSVAFNEELGRMTALSFPVITVPVLVLVVLAVQSLLRSISKLTGLDWKEILRA